jgi:hypothetical protein
MPCMTIELGPKVPAQDCGNVTRSGQDREFFVNRPGFTCQALAVHLPFMLGELLSDKDSLVASGCIVQDPGSFVQRATHGLIQG